MPSISNRARLGFTIVVGLLMALSLASVAHAEGVAATQTRISVWPEYDDPRVLVILQADLADDVELPTTVSFNIPKGAEIGMACEVSPSDSHSCKPYQLEDKGDYQTLSYTVDTQRKVFLEYYYEAFPAGAGARDFTVDFRPEFPAGTVTMEVQQPARATGFTLDPEFPNQSTDSQGMTYFTQEVADIPVGESLPVSISYSKADDKPSVEPKEASTGGGGSMDAAGQTSANNSVLLIAAVVGFAILLMLGYRSFRPSPATGSGRSRRPAARRQASATGRKSGKKNRGASGGFCTQCGETLGTEDRFCSECGTPAE